MKPPEDLRFTLMALLPPEIWVLPASLAESSVTCALGAARLLLAVVCYT